MVGKHFDVKVPVSRGRTDSNLDEKKIDKVGYVVTDTARGAVTDFWIGWLHSDLCFSSTNLDSRRTST